MEDSGMYRFLVWSEYGILKYGGKQIKDLN